MAELIGFIFEIIAHIFIEILLGGIFKLVHWIGLIGLKLITISTDSMEELGVKYKDSSIPYFLGFGILIGILCLVC